MLNLPTSPYLGQLEINRVYEYFDFPRLFSASNKTGASFLVVSTFDDVDQFEWLYLPISRDRLATVSSGKVTLRQAFTQPEEGYLFKVVTDFKGRGTVDHLLPEQILDEDLPSPGAKLTPPIEVERAPYGLGAVNAEAAAFASRRETYNLHLYPPGMTAPELSSRALGNLLVGIQDLVDAIGQSHSGEATSKGVIPADILKQTRLDACQIFEASFGLQLKGNQSPDLLNTSLLGVALSDLMTLFEIGADEDRVSIKLHEMKGRVASKYRKLLKDLVGMHSPLKIEWASPFAGRGGTATIDQQTLVAAYNVVSKISVAMAEEVSFRGELVGLDVSRQRFRVRDLETSAEYAGPVIGETVLASRSSVPGRYLVTLLKQEEQNDTSGQTRTKWSLVELESIPDTLNEKT